MMVSLIEASLSCACWTVREKTTTYYFCPSLAEKLIDVLMTRVVSPGSNVSRSANLNHSTPRARPRARALGARVIANKFYEARWKKRDISRVNNAGAYLWTTFSLTYSLSKSVPSFLQIVLIVNEIKMQMNLIISNYIDIVINHQSSLSVCLCVICL